ncbi:transposase [Candidatus Uhrbacteria bacterium]|nr:transposase [Candidatus Uhrbacteria bacterium]
MVRNHTLSIHHERHSLRYPGWDYSSPAGYFVTICTHERERLFGEIRDGEMIPNGYGLMVLSVWHALSSHYSCIDLDEFVVMPNHIHGIVWISRMPNPVGAGLKPAPTARYALPEIIRGLKTFSAHRINRLRGTPGIPVWQRSYHDRIIRNRAELEAFRTYIRNNPSKWLEDEYA